MIAHPKTASAVHHHGEQGQTLPSQPLSRTPPFQPLAYFTTDTIVYAASGHGAVISDNGKTRQELSPGDFALIPAWTEHQEVNDGDEEVTVRKFGFSCIPPSLLFSDVFPSARILQAYEKRSLYTSSKIG